MLHDNTQWLGLSYLHTDTTIDTHKEDLNTIVQYSVAGHETWVKLNTMFNLALRLQILAGHKTWVKLNTMLNLALRLHILHYNSYLPEKTAQILN